MSRRRSEGIVAVILAVGIATAVNLVTAGVLYDAIFSQGPGLSDNAVQLLTTAFGGIIGVLGAYIGFRAGTSAPGLNGLEQLPERAGGGGGEEPASQGGEEQEQDGHPGRDPAIEG